MRSWPLKQARRRRSGKREVREEAEERGRVNDRVIQWKRANLKGKGKERIGKYIGRQMGAVCLFGIGIFGIDSVKPAEEEVGF